MDTKYRLIMINTAENGKNYIDYQSELFDSKEEVINVLQDRDPNIIIKKVSMYGFDVIEDGVCNRYYIYPVLYQDIHPVVMDLNPHMVCNILYRGVRIIGISKDLFMMEIDSHNISTKRTLEEAFFFIDSYIFSTGMV